MKTIQKRLLVDFVAECTFSVDASPIIFPSVEKTNSETSAPVAPPYPTLKMCESFTQMVYQQRKRFVTVSTFVARRAKNWILCEVHFPRIQQCCWVWGPIYMLRMGQEDQRKTCSTACRQSMGCQTGNGPIWDQRSLYVLLLPRCVSQA